MFGGLADFLPMIRREGVRVAILRYRTAKFISGPHCNFLSNPPRQTPATVSKRTEFQLIARGVHVCM